MRIDLNSPAVQNSQAERSAKTNRTKGERNPAVESAANPPSSEDRVTLGSLAAKALETPEIRQDKVEALRQAIHDGTYSVDPEKIADAMLRGSEK